MMPERWINAGLALALLAIPLWAQATGEIFTVTLATRIAILALAGVGLNLALGQGGLISFGHAAFFGIGGYAMGMHLMREIGDRGVYANPDLPDFMVFLSYTELPWYWQGFDMFWFAALMCLFVPGLLAFVFGWFAFRSRVTGVYLSIITQALTYALMLAFFRNEMGFGGNNGLTDFKDVLGFDLQSDRTRVGLFVLSAIALAGGLLLCRAITTSKLGKVLVGVRKACQGRPVTEDDLALLAQRVEESIRGAGSAQIDAHEVGLAVLEPLRELDEVAYLRFASVYQAFDSLEDFEGAITLLRAERDATGEEPDRVAAGRQGPPGTGGG